MNLSKIVQTCLNLSKLVQTCPNLSKLVKRVQDLQSKNETHETLERDLAALEDKV